MTAKRDGEFSWRGRELRGKSLLPPVHDQGEKNTCIFHSLGAATESHYKRRGALSIPKEDFEVTLSIDDYVSQYNKMISGELGTEPGGGRGQSRMHVALRVLQEIGIAAEDPGLEGMRYKIYNWKMINKEDVKFKEIAEEIGIKARVMAAGFKISINFRTTKPGEIYSYEPNKREKNEDGVTRSHCVLVVGFGRREGQEYLVYQNSAGIEFGEEGFGRVYLKDVLRMATLNVI
uniref:Peptidase C1A papain C-terminal domain-containing protein n=1 Tax=Oryza meridionalis TaxID=40149 RepID=A0A0E0DW98_9ORYZ